MGDIDADHRLHAQVPEGLPSGPVRVLVLFPDEEEAGIVWANGVAKEWSEELADSGQDIYSLNDGLPLNAPR